MVIVVVVVDIQVLGRYLWKSLRLEAGVWFGNMCRFEWAEGLFRCWKN